MKNLLFTFLLCGFAMLCRAQDIPGYRNSNYAGISGLNLNPASIADSRYKFDMTLVGAGNTLDNNYVGIRRAGIWNPSDTGDFRSNYMREGVNSKSISVINQTYVQMPSFMVTISPKIALAFNFRVRNILNIDRVNPELAKLAYYGLDVPSLYNLKLENDKFSVNDMCWGEYGIGYAQVIKGKGKHFLKVGGQAKYIAGVAAAYMYARDLSYSWKNDTTLSVFTSEFGYGVSDNLDFYSKDFSARKFLKYVTKPSIGLDFGAVYEYRPNYKKFLYDLDGESDLDRRDKDKYMFRVGVSLLDIGRVKFQKSQGSGDFKIDVHDWNVNNLQFGEDPVRDFNDTIRNRFGIDTSVKEFNVALPTAFSIQVDYNIYKTFAVNFTSFVSPRFINDESKIHSMSYYSITPRWDHKWFGVYVPMSLNGYGQFNLGTGLRLGPVVIGSSNIGNFLVGKYITGLDGHFALKIPIMYSKPKDKDGDHVSNKRDRCPKIAGTWETRGCPDKDGDFIADKDDKCPDVRGIPEMKGCPDTDRDGITDAEDNCPEDAGDKALNGCPDKDGDGIIDIEDKCPEISGLRVMFGCPDTDQDGISDMADNCPTEAGPEDNSGCPYGDLDKDGTVDKNDKCPELAGDPNHFGCPDSDADGIYDDEDGCPQTAGPLENNGCPIVKEEEKEVLVTAFKNMEFEPGSAVILLTSYPTMNELAKLLEAKPTWKLKIAGHTDNSGNEQVNLDLSRRRSLAVKTYLVNLGIDEKRIIAEYYGSSKPLESNDTPEGRQKNRRVEMEIVFD